MNRLYYDIELAVVIDIEIEKKTETDMHKAFDKKTLPVIFDTLRNCI